MKVLNVRIGHQIYSAHDLQNSADRFDLLRGQLHQNGQERSSGLRFERQRQYVRCRSQANSIIESGPLEAIS